MTQLILLVLAALVIPLAWGYVAHWLLERCWPRRKGVVRGGQKPDAGEAEYLDFQI
jgi:hypothetical protein